MKVTAKMYLSSDSNHPAKLASGYITLADAFFVADVSLYKGKNGEPFVKMPCYKAGKDENGKDKFQDRCFCMGNDDGKQLRTDIAQAVIAAYQATLKESEQANINSNSQTTSNNVPVDNSQDDFEYEF